MKTTIAVFDYTTGEIHIYKTKLKPDIDSAEEWLRENTDHHLNQCEWMSNDTIKIIKH